MKFEKTGLPGTLRVRLEPRRDRRGIFSKAFHSESWRRAGVQAEWKEIYWSVSVPGTLRGLHFQTPPSEHAKAVFCLSGEVFDACVDLRSASPTFRSHWAGTLSAGEGLFIPKGLAHGFCVPEREATLLYLVESVHDPERDSGIRWDSAGIAWPISDPVVSERDAALPGLEAFETPFRNEK